MVERIAGRVADVLAPRAAVPHLVRRLDLQGLRGVAVLLVALAHAGLPGLGGGYVGVDVFLVLSGYLITCLLLAEATSTGSVSLVSFYARRARRILPAATLTLVATAVVATLTLPYVRAQQIVTDVVWATFFAANVHVAALGTDYFTADLPPSPVQHYWSLAVEEQFYLVWPALLVLMLAVGLGRHRFGAVGARRRLPLLGLVVLSLSAASFGWALNLTSTYPIAAYFSTPARVWELGAGVLLALTGQLPTRLPFPAQAVLSWGGLGAVAAAAVTYDAASAMPATPALLPVVGTVALLAAGAAGHGGAYRLLSCAPLSRLGDLSYGFYLWHWPFLVIPAAYLGRDLGLVTNLALLLAALTLSALTYRLLENPIRRVRVLTHRPHLTLSLWPLAVTAVLISALWSDGRIAVAAYAGDPVAIQSADGSQALITAVDQAVEQAKAGAPLPKVVQDLRTLAQDKWERDETCVAGPDESSAAICPAGDTTADRTIVLLGDSHSGMWLPPLDRLGKQEGWRIVPLTKYGCTAVDWTQWRQELDEPATDCSGFHDWAMDQVADIQPEVVVVASRASVAFANGDGDGPAGSARAALAAWQTGMRRLVDELSSSGAVVRLVLDTPAVGVDPAECLSNSGSTMASCTIDMPALVADVNDRTRAAAAATGAVAVDMTPFVCSEDSCPMVVSNIAVYADDNHLSATYVDQISPAFGNRLHLPGD